VWRYGRLMLDVILANNVLASGGVAMGVT